jgi:hypothetical protein
VRWQWYILRPAAQVVNEDGTLGWSPVYAFPHYERAGTYDYVVVTTEGGAEVRMVFGIIATTVLSLW